MESYILELPLNTSTCGPLMVHSDGVSGPGGQCTSKGEGGNTIGVEWVWLYSAVLILLGGNHEFAAEVYVKNTNEEQSFFFF